MLKMEMIAEFTPLEQFLKSQLADDCKGYATPYIGYHYIHNKVVPPQLTIDIFPIHGPYTLVIVVTNLANKLGPHLPVLMFPGACSKEVCLLPSNCQIVSASNPSDLWHWETEGSSTHPLVSLGEPWWRTCRASEITSTKHSSISIYMALGCDCHDCWNTFFFSRALLSQVLPTN